MPFVVFSIGSALVVLGFTFRVIQVTSGLTEMKSSQARVKFRNIGITSLIAGFLIALVSLIAMVGNERIIMITVGGEIAALGISTLIQYKLNHRNQRFLEWAAWGIIIVGVIMWIVYELTIFIKAL